MKKLSFLLFLVLTVSTGYSRNVSDTAQHVNLDTVTVNASAGAPVYRASATRVWDIKNTRIALNFNWKEKTAGAREWIKLHPYFYATDTMVLDAKSMRIDSVMLVGKKGNTKLDYTYEKDQLKIRFGQKYKMNDTVELYLKYTAMPYAAQTGGSGAITDDRGLYFINTDYKVPHKPSQIWTQGESESNSHWMITIDKPNSRTTTQIELTVPDSMTTLSNGAMIKQIKGYGHMRTDIWRMDMPMQVYVAMFAIGKFSIIKDQWNKKEVNYYVEPEFASSAKLMFNHTPEMMEYFSKRTGVPFPWNKYDQVVVRDYVSGAMENTTAALFGEFMNQNAREIADRNSEDVVSHELFHEWFGDYVTCESWSNITVNESFANYGEQLWRTHKYGKASGDELAYNDLQGYIGSSQLVDPQLVRFYYESREDVFDAISYNKGGATLRYMNTIMGDEAFDKSMNIYLTKNALHSAEAHNWRLAVEEATGQDWNWFFNEWYFHAGHPVLRIVYNYNDTTQNLTVTVSQVQTEAIAADSNFVYQLPLKATVIYGNEKSIIDWNITKKKETFVYAYKNGQKPVIIPDCEHVLPGEIKDGKKPAQWYEQFKQSEDYVSKKLAVSAAGRVTSDSTSQAIIDLALVDKINSIRQNALSQLEKLQSDKYRRRWTNKIIAMAMNDSDKEVRATAFSVLGEWKVNAAKQNMISVLHDSSYALAGKALEALGKIDNDTAYILAKTLVNTDPRSTLDASIWSIVGKKGADEDIALIEQKAPYVSGTKKFSFSFSLNSYLKNVKSEASFRKGVDIYVTMITTENMKQYRTTLGSFLFQVAGEQKEKTKSDNKDEAAAAQKKLDIVKSALQIVVADEKDADAQKEYKKMMKDTFE